MGGQIFWFVIIHLRPIIPYGHPTDTTDRPRIHPFRSPFRQLAANKKLSSPDVSACRQTSLSKDVSHFIPASTKVVKRYQPSHLREVRVLSLATTEQAQSPQEEVID